MQLQRTRVQGRWLKPRLAGESGGGVLNVVTRTTLPPYAQPHREIDEGALIVRGIWHSLRGIWLPLRAIFTHVHAVWKHTCTVIVGMLARPEQQAINGGLEWALRRRFRHNAGLWPVP